MKKSNYHNGYIWSGESELPFFDLRLNLLINFNQIIFSKKNNFFILSLFFTKIAICLKS